MTEAERQRVRELLEVGLRRSEIARQVGVSPSTITRTARLLGFADARPRPSATDWAEVRAFYEAGHTIDECRERFEFTYGAWDKAVVRGEIVPRSHAEGALRRATKDAVEDLLARGWTQSRIALPRPLAGHPR